MNDFIRQYYQKSIRLTPNGFSLYKREDDGQTSVEHFQNTENVLLGKKASDFFGLEATPYQPIDIVTATHAPMLVPDEIYDDAKAAQYLQLQFDISQFGHHFSDQLSHYRALYFLTQNEYSTINELSCLPRFVNEATLLHRFLSDQAKDDAVLLSVNDTFADLIALHKGEPTLVNRITRMENVDILYYTLNCMQQFLLSDPTLYVLYFYQPNRKLNELLGKYHKNVIIL